MPLAEVVAEKKSAVLLAVEKQKKADDVVPICTDEMSPECHLLITKYP